MAAAAVMAALSLQTASAAKLVELRVVDKDYLMVHLRDGEVHYRDNGTGESAYLGTRLPKATTRSWCSDGARMWKTSGMRPCGR